ncbi:HSP20 family protein [Chitinophaga jiangningensis]|uniref:HSP20 family protein n=1 Tax=Chitinophaga jiangningensis TaxID=1419482 RepID=A0A1M7B737_9BACT|nr:Hsp20/alpha crystallin family protein [Chitinophaga jiangningensis]SHL50449.1 HSP20 family protein [Chitinophaga jiangningensis]
MNTLMKKNGNGLTSAASFSSMVDRIFQDNLSRFFDDPVWSVNGSSRSRNIPTNIRETDTGYQLQLAAPGLKKEDFKINLEGDTLTIRVDQQQESSQENKAEGWLKREFQIQSFSRSFQLDDTIDASNISARYADGILQVELLKKEGAQKVSRHIEIQ